MTINDELLTKARRITGVAKNSRLVQAALEALIERESARRLALLGGTEPELESIPRQQSGDS